MARTKKQVEQTTAVVESDTPPVIVGSTKTTPKPLLNHWHLTETRTIEPWCFASEIFTSEELDTILSIGENPELSSEMSKGTTVGPASTARSCYVSWINSGIPENAWIFQRLTTAVNNINSKFFNYDLLTIDSLQFTKYISDSEDHYKSHRDMLYSSFTTRKLSFSMMLSDPADYEGGDLLLHLGEDPEKPKKDRGTVVFFPSFVLHEVTPVTKGVRYSLVGWVSGPPFK